MNSTGLPAAKYTVSDRVVGGTSATWTCTALDRRSQGGVAAMTPYDFVMEEVTLAILRVADALMANEPFAIARESTDARRVYRDIRELYPKLQLQATERDSLLGQMSLLRSQLNQCEAFLQRPFADAG
jgi:hypothetical protein